MLGIGGEVVPEMLEVSSLATLDQRERHFTVEVEVPQIAHQPDIFPIADAGQEGVHQHQPVRLLRELRGVSVSHHQSDVVADHLGALESERHDESVDVHSHVFLVVAGFWFRGIARAAQIGNDDCVVLRQ